MKEKIFLKFFYILFFLVIIANGVFMFRDKVTVNMHDLPEGTLKKTVVSDDKKITVCVYGINNSLGKAVRVEAMTSEEKRNIFWLTGYDDVDIYWKSDTVIFINGVYIDIPDKGFYDCRHKEYIFASGINAEGREYHDE